MKKIKKRKYMYISNSKKKKNYAWDILSESVCPLINLSPVILTLPSPKSYHRTLVRRHEGGKGLKLRGTGRFLPLHVPYIISGLRSKRKHAFVEPV
jgi:hypothetical protein